MNSLFGEGDVRAARMVSLTLVVFMGTAVLGISNQSNIVPNPVLHDGFVIAAVLVGVVWTAMLRLDRNPANKLNQSSWLRRGATLLGAFTFLAFFVFFTLSLGLPTLWSRLVATEVTANTSVTRVMKERSGRGCHYRMDISGGPLPGTMTPCVSRELWASLRAGDTVSIKYTRTGLAFIIEDIQRVQVTGR